MRFRVSDSGYQIGYKVPGNTAGQPKSPRGGRRRTRGSVPWTRDAPGSAALLTRKSARVNVL